MKIISSICYWWIVTISLLISIPVGLHAQSENVKDEILKHGEVIRQAFADGDIDKIAILHHPSVVKALGYNDLKNGLDEVIAGVRETLANFELEFIKNDVENILIKGDLAVEQTRFSIRGTPKDGSDSWIFSGRTMVTYVRYEQSPTGWATIREIIQPAN